jgi:hypothetical protein
MDDNGNAKGGVRNTYVDVPVAQYGVPKQRRPEAGHARRLLLRHRRVRAAMSPEQLQALYKDSGSYRNKVKQRLEELTKAGWFLPEYASQVTGRRLRKVRSE